MQQPISSVPAFNFDFLEKRQFQEAEALVKLRRQFRELESNMVACTSRPQREAKERRKIRLQSAIERHTARLANYRRQRSEQRRSLVA